MTSAENAGKQCRFWRRLTPGLGKMVRQNVAVWQNKGSHIFFNGLPRARFQLSQVSALVLSIPKRSTSISPWASWR